MTERAQDLMSAALLSVTPDTSLLEVNRLLVENELHALPVIDRSGSLVGFLSTLDLLRAVDDGIGSAASQRDPDPRGDEFPARWSRTSAADVMQRPVFTVPEDAPVPAIAKLLREARFHHLVVERGGRPVGVVSSLDLLALLEGG